MARWGALLCLLFLLGPAGARAQEADAEAPPEPERPAETEEPSAVELRPGHVRFRADAPLDILYVPDAALDESEDGAIVVRSYPRAAFQELCTTPCEADLPRGHFALAVSREGHVHVFSEPLGVDGPMGIWLTWDAREAEHLAGTLLLAVGTPLFALTAILLPVIDVLSRSTFGDLGAVGVGVGAAGLVASVVLGVVFVLTEEGATLSATPLPTNASELFSSEWR